GAGRRAGPAVGEIADFGFSLPRQWHQGYALSRIQQNRCPLLPESLCLMGSASEPQNRSPLLLEALSLMGRASEPQNRYPLLLEALSLMGRASEPQNRYLLLLEALSGRVSRISGAHLFWKRFSGRPGPAAWCARSGTGSGDRDQARD